MANNQETNEPKTLVLSESEERLLIYLERIVRTLHQHSNEPNQDKSFSKAFRDPVVVAALVTVLIGGILATVITGIIQWSAKDKDFELAKMKAKSDLDLARYKEYLDQERALISRIYNLSGQCISASDSLIGLTESAWRNVPADNPDVKAIVKDYNLLKIKWNSEVAELGQLMDFYHPSETKVMTAWGELRDAIDEYLTCALTLYVNHRAPNDPPTKEQRDDCERKRGQITEGLTVLASSRRLGLTPPP